MNWKLNRGTLFLLFMYTAFYTIINPKPAKRILELYEKGLEYEAMEDL